MFVMEAKEVLPTPAYCFLSHDYVFGEPFSLVEEPSGCSIALVPPLELGYHPPPPSEVADC